MKLRISKIGDLKRPVLLKNIIISFIIALSFLFFGLYISYLYVILLPGDPVILLLQAQGVTHPSAERIAAMRQDLGLDLPVFLRFLRFLSGLFTGRENYSFSVAPGVEGWDLITDRLPITIVLLILPTIIGLVLGIVLGKIAIKFRNKWQDKIIQAFYGIGIASPIFFLLMTFQYYVPSVWGFGVLVLSITITALVTWLVRANIEKEPYEKSIFLNTMTTVMILGLIFIYIIAIEVTLNLRGFGRLFLDSLLSYEYFILPVIVATIIICFVIITFVSNIIFSILNSPTNNPQNSMENNPSPQLDNKIARNEIDPETKSIRDLRKYLKYIYKSPFTLIGLIMVLGIIIVALFAQVISGYSLSEINGMYPSPWEPPSADHILGTGQLGRDVFAQVLYGTRDAILFGFGVILIGMIIGAIFGLLSSLHKYANIAIEAIMSTFFIVPGTLLIFLITIVFGFNIMILGFIMGILSIPFFTRIIANPPLEKRNILKSLKQLVIYLPLIFGFIILIYETIGFLGLSLGFNDLQLGYQIYSSWIFLYIAFHASFWPALFIFFIVLGLILLHIGLKETLLDQSKSSRFP